MAQKKTPREQIGVDLPPDEEPQTELPVAATEAETPPEEPERPGWLPEQYKDEQAFADAHRSLQERLRQEAENRKQLEQNLAEREAQMQELLEAQNTRDAETDTLSAVADEIAAAREAGDVRRELELNQWLNEYTMRSVLQTAQTQNSRVQAPLQQAVDDLAAAQVDAALSGRYDDWDDYREKVHGVVSREPWRLPDEALDSTDTAQKALAAVYESIKNSELLQELEERGLSQTDIGRARKLQAQTMTGASGRPDEPSDADRRLAEMKEALTQGSWAAVRGGR